MDAVDQDASSFASDMVTKLLGAEELSKDWAQSLGYSRAPGDSPLFDEKIWSYCRCRCNVER